MGDLRILNDVDSSAIDSIAYDKDEKKLWIRFTSGSLYEYRNVEESTVNELDEAESKGKYFHNNIKDRFDYEKVDE